MVVARELGGLGPEQQGQRFSRQVPLRFGGGLDGELCVPRADRDDTRAKERHSPCRDGAPD